MSSSDSDSDCYGGAAGRLCNLKSQFVPDLPMKDGKHGLNVSNYVEKENTWEDIQQSFQIPEDILKKCLPKKRCHKSSTKSESNQEAPVETKCKKRQTRNSQNAVDKPVTPPKKNIKSPLKKRKRNATNRVRPESISNMSRYPTYLVGERDGYIDHSAGIRLFQNSEPSKKNPQNVDCISSSESDVEESPLDESIINPVMSVKVHWKSKEFQKFFIRKFQKITSIFEHFSKTDDVKWENLYFDYNNQLLKPSDTPDSIGYNIGKFIEGGIVQQNVFELTKYLEGEKGVSSKLDIKFQVANRKNPIFVKLGQKEKFMVAMIKLAEELVVLMTELKFTFDGDAVDPQSSPEDLDFEGGECIDVAVCQ